MMLRPYAAGHRQRLLPAQDGRAAVACSRAAQPRVSLLVWAESLSNCNRTYDTASGSIGHALRPPLALRPWAQGSHAALAFWLVSRSKVHAARKTLRRATACE